jgi:hypothetical protein
MPWKGNGPVGIWAWESDSVIIQHCISYRNRTAPGARDGGGFDLDGGITNSIVQYNLSYDNEGYGFGIFQFPGATPWHDNIFRYNISINDGNTVQDGASVVYWNGDDDSTKFRNCKIYNNLFINRHGPVLSYVDGKYRNSSFYFLNNIFIAKDQLIAGGGLHNEFFYGNIWWSLQDKFKLNSYSSFTTWVNDTGKEKLNGKITGSNVDPRLLNPVNPTLTDARKLKTLTGYNLKNTSPLKNKGVDIRKEFGFFPGLHDFFDNRIPQGKNYEPGVHEVN